MGMEFEGGKLDDLPDDAALDANVWIGIGGKLRDKRVYRNAITGTWRLVFEVEPDAASPLSMMPVMKAVTTRTTMPILKQIYLKGEQNILKLICADTEITIERHVKCVVEEEGELLVNAKNFNEIIKKLPKSDIIFSLKERNLMIESENCVTSSRNFFPVT